MFLLGLLPVLVGSTSFARGRSLRRGNSGRSGPDSRRPHGCHCNAGDPSLCLRQLWSRRVRLFSKLVGGNCNFLEIPILGCSLGGFSTKWLWNGYVTSMMNPSESKCWRSTQIRKIFALCHVYALQPLIDCVLDLLKMLLSLFLPVIIVSHR